MDPGVRTYPSRLRSKIFRCIWQWFCMYFVKIIITMYCWINLCLLLLHSRDRKLASIVALGGGPKLYPSTSFCFLIPRSLLGCRKSWRDNDLCLEIFLIRIVTKLLGKQYVQCNFPPRVLRSATRVYGILRGFFRALSSGFDPWDLRFEHSFVTLACCLALIDDHFGLGNNV